MQALGRKTARRPASDSPQSTRKPIISCSRCLVLLVRPRMTILSASSGNGRCIAFASSQGARIQTSRSSSVVRITGIAFGWIGSTTAFGAVVRNP